MSYFFGVGFHSEAPFTKKRSRRMFGYLERGTKGLTIRYFNKYRRFWYWIGLTFRYLIILMLF